VLVKVGWLLVKSPHCHFMIFLCDVGSHTPTYLPHSHTAEVALQVEEGKVAKAGHPDVA
jgi:hypothetical protein